MVPSLFEVAAGTISVNHRMETRQGNVSQIFFVQKIPMPRNGQKAEVVVRGSNDNKAITKMIKSVNMAMNEIGCTIRAHSLAKIDELATVYLIALLP